MPVWWQRDAGFYCIALCLLLWAAEDQSLSLIELSVLLGTLCASSDLTLVITATLPQGAYVCYVLLCAYTGTIARRPNPDPRPHPHRHPAPEILLQRRAQTQAAHPDRGDYRCRVGRGGTQSPSSPRAPALPPPFHSPLEWEVMTKVDDMTFSAEKAPRSVRRLHPTAPTPALTIPWAGHPNAL
jgi:hypothetical protein